MEEELTKNYVETPNHRRWGGESLWAKSLRNGKYGIRSVPFAAHGIGWAILFQLLGHRIPKTPEFPEYCNDLQILRFEFPFLVIVAQEQKKEKPSSMISINMPASLRMRMEHTLCSMQKNQNHWMQSMIY